MGYERGFVGGLRLSMERRRLTNARITSMRYRKYQELRIRLEQEEMRKAAEILERRRKERARLNQYIHSVYQPHVKPQHNLKVQRNRHTGRGEFFKRPPWSTSLIQDQESILRLRQKEMSVMNAGLVDTRRRDYDPMLQVRVTAQRDAMVDLKACNSRYPIYETEESKVQETTYSYLHTHLHNDFLDKELQKLEVEKLNIHTTVDEDLLVAEADVFRDYTSKSSKPGLGSLRPPKTPTAETDVFRNLDVKSSRMGLAIRLPTSPTPNSLKPSLKLGKNTSRSFCLFGGQNFRVIPGVVERLSSCELDMRMSTTSTLPPQVSQKEFAYAEAPSTSSNDLRQEKTVSKLSKAPLCPSGLLKQRKIASKQISNEKNVGVVSVGKSAFGAIVPKLILPQSQETESTSSALRHFSDGETTSYLTEELFLASLENEAATTRLIQEVTSRFDGCRLIPLDHRNILSMPASNNESGFRPPAQTIKVTTNISAHNENVVREDRKEMAERLSKQSHNNSQNSVNNEEVKVEHHICSNRRQASPQSNNMMENCATIDLCPEETRSPVTQNNNVAFKVEGHLQIMRKHEGELTLESNVQPESMKRYLKPINVIHDVGNDRIGYEHCQRTNDEKCSTVQLSAVGGIRDAEISSISRARSIDNGNRRSPAHVLSPLYTESEHEIEHRMNNIKSIARAPMSLSYVNSDISLVTNRVEAAVTSGASTTRVVDCQCPSNNPGVLSQSSKLSLRKLDVPCNMQSVYKRCNLDSVRLPGYTALCTVNYGAEAKQHESHVQVRPPSAKLASILSHSEDVPTRSPESTFREEINMYHDVSGNKENLGKENCYADMCTPGSEEEMNILASLERLDWKLAAITGRAMNGGRNSLNSQGHCSAKSAQSAPAVLAHEKPSSTTLGQVGLVCGKPKNCTFMNASRPSSAKLPPQKPPRGFRQRQVVGVTNKCHGKIHQLYPKSQGNIPPVTVFPDPKSETSRPPSIPGSIMCYKDPHYLLNPPDPL